VIADCLLAGVVLFAPVFFKLDRYRPLVIIYFEENTGKKAEVERLALSFFPLVTIHIFGFGVKSPPLFPPSYIVKVARADAVLDFWALLRRNVIIKSVILEDPEINLVSGPDGPWNFENPSSFSSISTDLELANQRISSKTMDIDGYGVDVDGSGSVSAGSGELNYQGIAAITTKQGFLTNLFGRLEGAKLTDGKLSFPFRISGTIDNPKFTNGTKSI
jgi:uncharacterized protein involved in outer membrane biogenesis